MASTANSYSPSSENNKCRPYLQAVFRKGDSDDCSFTLTSDDEERERRMSLVTPSTVLQDKDSNVGPDPTNTTAHNDEDFLNELVKENRQLETEWQQIMNKKVPSPRPAPPVQEPKSAPVPVPVPSAPPPSDENLPSPSRATTIQSAAHVSPRSGSQSVRVPEEEGETRRCRSLQLRLAGAQKTIKRLEDDNMEKEKEIAELTGKLENAKKGTVSTKDIDMEKELELAAANARAKEMDEKNAELQREIEVLKTAASSGEKSQKMDEDMRQQFEARIEEYYLGTNPCRLQKQTKKAQGKAEYFEKELKLQGERYRALQTKSQGLLRDAENICKSYARFSQIASKLAY